MRYANRHEAGRHLAGAIAGVVDGETDGCVVVGIPRGGVLVAAPVAVALNAEIDVAVARKIGAPMQPELAIGAVSASGPPYLNRALIGRLGIPDAYLESEIGAQRHEAARREVLYRQERGALEFVGRTVVVVDDGVATGATLVAVLRMLRTDAGRVVAAVPVGPRDTLDLLQSEADDLVCPMVPRWFSAVGEWYDDFRQTTDDEVLAALA